MLEALAAPDHVVAFRLSGEVTGDDIETAAAAIDAALERHQRIGLYADASGLDGFTAEAFAKDLRYGLGKLGQLGRFTRSAVITDKAWLRNLARFEDRLFPQIEIRAFDREAARGMRLDIPAGTAVRFEPGQTRDVTLVPFSGERRVFGFNGEVMGAL